MPRTIRFHLDENCNLGIAAGLRRRGVDVTTAQEAGLLQAADADHVAFALSDARVIFTHDADFLRLHAAGVEHAGIAFSPSDSRSIGAVIRGLVLIWELLEPDEMRGRVEHV